jgi:hypothetical protein
MTWPLGFVPTVASNGTTQTVLIVPDNPNYMTKSAAITLYVAKAGLVKPEGLAFDITYGEKLGTTAAGFKNARNADYQTAVTLTWENSIEYLTVGTYYIYATARATGAESNNYEPTRIQFFVNVAPYVINTDSTKGNYFSASFTGKVYAYSTDFAKISGDIQAEINSRVLAYKIAAGTPDAVVGYIKANLKVSVDGLELNMSNPGSTMPGVKWVANIVGGTYAPYNASVLIDQSEGNVLFATSEGTTATVPNFDAQFSITRYVLSSSNISAVSENTYNGLPQSAVITFVKNRGVNQEELIISPEDLTLSYTLNAADIDGAPVQAGEYRARIAINANNYVTNSPIVVAYTIKQSTDFDTYLTGLGYNDETLYNGDRIYLKFRTDDSNAPYLSSEPDNNAVHKFTWNIIVEGGKTVSIAGDYVVTFVFRSPNFSGEKRINLQYHVEAVELDDPDCGIPAIYDEIFAESDGGNVTIVVEYTGGAIAANDIFRYATAFDLAKYGITYDMLVSNGAEIKNIGEYGATLNFYSDGNNYYGEYTVPGYVTIKIVKKTVAISVDSVSMEFDGEAKSYMPNVNTGIAGVLAEFDVIKVIDKKTGKEISVPQNVGEYVFTYALKTNPYITMEGTKDVTVKIAKAAQAKMEALIRANVTFNDAEKRVADGETVYTAAILENNLDAKYGIKFVRIDSKELKEPGIYVVKFIFVSDNYDITNGELEYSLYYSVDEKSNAGLIAGVVGGTAGLGGLIYLAVYLSKKKKALVQVVAPQHKTPTVYAQPKYKPEANPKPPKPPKPAKPPKVKVDKKKAAQGASSAQAAVEPDFMSNMKFLSDNSGMSKSDVKR